MTIHPVQYEFRLIWSCSCRPVGHIGIKSRFGGFVVVVVVVVVIAVVVVVVVVVVVCLLRSSEKGRYRNLRWFCGQIGSFCRQKLDSGVVSELELALNNFKDQRKQSIRLKYDSKIANTNTMMCFS